MRIIAGKHRGRFLKRPPSTITRPMMDRVRESIFNMLTHNIWGGKENVIEGAIVLDAFAGSGALALEALSRGAKFAYLFDKNNKALSILHENVKALGEEATTRILKADATHPPKNFQPATLVFLDPPFGKGLLSRALPLLYEAGWLAENSLIIAEIEARESYHLPNSFKILREKVCGTVKIIFIEISHSRASI